MHVHVRHTDWLIGAEGEAIVSLVDLRAGSGTAGRHATVRLSMDSPRVLMIPPGVLHGIYTPVRSVLLNAMSHEYDPSDDLAVRFDDPWLRLDWCVADPVLSERDQLAPSIDILLEQLAVRGVDVMRLAA